LLKKKTARKQRYKYLGNLDSNVVRQTTNSPDKGSATFAGP